MPLRNRGTLRSRRRNCTGIPSLTEGLSNGGPTFTVTTGWAPTAGCAVSVAGGELVLTMTAAAAFPGATLTFTAEVGRTYRVTVVCRRGTSTDPVALNLSGCLPAVNTGINTTAVNNIFSIIVQATSTSMFLNLFASSGSAAAGTEILTSASCKRLQL